MNMPFISRRAQPTSIANFQLPAINSHPVAQAPSQMAVHGARPASSSAHRQAVIEIGQMTKTYQMGENQIHALRGVSLTIHSGEYVAIIGASGSGKSTLMNMIGLLDRPSSGAYYLQGVEVSGMDKSQLATLRNRQIGFVFQRFHLLPRTPAQRQVELPLFYAGVPDRTARRRALDALAQVGLGERVDHRPDELSGGQQQRVAIARALVTQPSILLADEPTGALDSQTGKEVMALFHELNEQGITLIVVTHDLGIASQAQRIITLRDGEIISDAPAARQTSPFLSASTNGQGARPAIPAQEVLA